MTNDVWIEVEQLRAEVARLRSALHIADAEVERVHHEVRHLRDVLDTAAGLPPTDEDPA